MSDARNSVPTFAINTGQLSQLADTLLKEIGKQIQADSACVAEAKLKAQQILEAAAKVAASHSGSNFGYHGDLYYRDFQIPPVGSMFSVEWGVIHGVPPGWAKKEPEEVKRKIEVLSALSIPDVEHMVKKPLDSAKHLHREMLIRLAPLHQLSEGNRERQLLDNLEHFDWHDSAHNNYASAAVNSYPNVSRDSGAIFQGRMLTSHNYYEAVATQVKRSCEAIEEFWNLTDRFLRQFQVVSSSTLVSRIEHGDDSNLAARYERLKTGTLLLAAFVSSAVIATGVKTALKKWPWPWLAGHPNSYSIQWLSYAVLLLFLVGLFVRRFRNFCWGVAIIPLVVGVLQSLGGPPHTP